MFHDTIPDDLTEAVLAYIKELETPSVVSYSHQTLAIMYGKFGRTEVDNELEYRFLQKRIESEERRSAVVSKERGSL